MQLHFHLSGRMSETGYSVLIISVKEAEKVRGRGGGSCCFLSLLDC